MSRHTKSERQINGTGYEVRRLASCIILQWRRLISSEITPGTSTILEGILLSIDKGLLGRIVKLISHLVERITNTDLPSSQQLTIPIF